jgi:protein TonB
VWTTSAGLLGQASVVTAAILGTLLWPEALPKVQSVFVAPVPVKAPEQTVAARPKSAAAVPRPQFDFNKLVQPSVPTHVHEDRDAPEAPTIVGAMTGGASSASDFMVDFLGPAPPPAQPAVEKPKPVVKPVEADAEPIQRVAGGRVSPPKLLRQVQPIYPQLARTAHIGGKVELTGVIGADGRVRELRVLGGHPLLTKAALDAVAQWIYEPTRLNGKIVEVITNITVSFQLNQ